MRGTPNPECPLQIKFGFSLGKNVAQNQNDPDGLTLRIPPPTLFWWFRGIISIIQLPHHAPRRQLTHWT